MKKREKRRKKDKKEKGEKNGKRGKEKRKKWGKEEKTILKEDETLLFFCINSSGVQRRKFKLYFFPFISKY